jgi:hypothetical protein
MYRVRGGNKYHAESQNYNGHHYDSKAEAAYAMELDLRQKAGQIKSWQPHVKIPLMVNGNNVGVYEIDFQVIHNDGHFEFVEVKGKVLPLWAMKWKIFESTYELQWPDADLTVVRVFSKPPKWNTRDVNKAIKRVRATRQSRSWGSKAI